MTNHLRSPAENYDKPGSDLPEENRESDRGAAGKEFFARWLHRKQEHELGRSVGIENRAEENKDSAPATRLSRLLHRLELKPEERNIELRRTGPEANRTHASGELLINQGAESSGEQRSPEQSETEEEPNAIEEAVFDIRHEELDYAGVQAKPVPPSSKDEEEDEEIAEAPQQPTAVSSILAAKPYAQAKQPGLPKIEEVPTDQPATIKTYKTYILYGFLAGFAVVLTVTIFVIASR